MKMRVLALPVALSPMTPPAQSFTDAVHYSVNTAQPAVLLDHGHGLYPIAVAVGESFHKPLSSGTGGIFVLPSLPSSMP